MSKKIRIGTSGFLYKDWGPKFYPEDLPQKKYLSYFAERFDTLEINSSFYRIPSAETFKKWKHEVPDDFIFAVKISRYITHVKRLIDIEDTWKFMLDNAKKLGDKMGPFLIQFPPSFKKNLERFSHFVKLLLKTGPKHRYAFEFRHESWFDSEVFSFLKQQRKLHFSIVTAYSKKWPILEKQIGEFVYIRMHGSKKVYESNYSKKDLNELAEKVKKIRGKDVYVYFNNDVKGYAVDNAKYLQKIIVPHP